MDEYVGCRVSLDCGQMGFFQGVINRINLQEQTVTLEKPFENGLACKFPEVTLSATMIQELKILKSRSEVVAEAAPSTATSTVKVEKKKSKEKVHAEKVPAEQREKGREGGRQAQPLLQPMPTRVTRDAINRASPRFRDSRSSPKRGYEDAGYGRNRNQSESDRSHSRQQRTGLPGEDQYGGQALTEEELHLVEEEFDFEGNLAMFDKKAEWAEIDAELSTQPDIVRLVHCNKRQPEAKYRNDENVLASVAAEYRQITTGEQGEGEFLTDQGLVVPAISLQLRERLQAVITNHGLTLERQAEVMGRAATELCLQLLGGGHRLNPTNMHQVPTAVFLCGINNAGALGLAGARHLAGHGVRSMVYLPEAAVYPHTLETELRLYRLTGGQVVHRGRDLPAGSVDLVVTAMEDQEMWSQERCQPWHRGAVSWAEGRRAPVLAIDPPPHAPALPVKMALMGSLPLSHPKEAGQLYLANMGIPKNVYKEVGIKFLSPFGAKFVIPLHHATST